MGYAYAGDALALIVADYNGLTKEEIFEINNKTYAACLEQYFDDLTNESGVSMMHLIEKKDDGKYYLRGDVNFEDVQRGCLLGAEIGFGLRHHKPKFWKGKIFPLKDVPGDCD